MKLQLYLLGKTIPLNNNNNNNDNNNNNLLFIIEMRKTLLKKISKQS